VILLVVCFFYLLDSRLNTVPSLETNIISALEGEINICVQLYIHTHIEREILYTKPLYCVLLKIHIKYKYRIKTSN